MPSSVVKEQIYKLKLDAADLQQKLQNAIKDVGNFQQKMDSINGKSVENVEKSTANPNTLPGFGASQSKSETPAQDVKTPAAPAQTPAPAAPAK